MVNLISAKLGHFLQHFLGVLAFGSDRINLICGLEFTHFVQCEVCVVRAVGTKLCRVIKALLTNGPQSGASDVQRIQTLRLVLVSKTRAEHRCQPKKGKRGNRGLGG